MVEIAHSIDHEVQSLSHFIADASWDLEEWFAMFHERNDVVRTAVERQRAWIQKLKDDFEKSCMEK